MRQLVFWAFATVLFAAPVSYESLIGSEPSRARDFATLLYMDEVQDRVKNRTLFYRLTTPKSAHIDRLLERTGSVALRNLVECRSKSTKDLLGSSSDCLAIAIAPARIEHLSMDERKLVAKKIARIDPFKAAVADAMASNDPFASKDLDLFFAIALGTSDGYFDTLFDYPMGLDLIGSIAKDRRVSKLLERAATTQKGRNIKRFLIEIDPRVLDSRGAFYFGILMLDDEQRAIGAFTQSKKVAENREVEDRATFWQYLLTKDLSFLTKLSKSSSINIYSLYARDLLGVEYPYVIRSVAGGSKHPAVKEKELHSPFFWASLIRTIDRGADTKRALDRLGETKAYEPYRAALSYGRSAAHIFLDPYPDLMLKFSPEQKALFLAIMRQESRFMPAALSTSYAMGAMQMMPFLIEHMKKERNDKRRLWDFFDPNYQIPYAKRHIEWLEKKLPHPLYVAYAYNGGIGYTNRTIEGYKLFGKGKYEPFLSMERVNVEETREYGKIVLANYLVYLRLFKKHMKATDLIGSLTPTGKLLKE